MFERTRENTIREKVNSGKAIVVVGARQVGKTTLINEILKGKDFLFLDADDPSTRNLLHNPTTEQIRTISVIINTFFLMRLSEYQESA